MNGVGERDEGDASLCDHNHSQNRVQIILDFGRMAGGMQLSLIKTLYKARQLYDWLSALLNMLTSRKLRLARSANREHIVGIS